MNYQKLKKIESMVLKKDSDIFFAEPLPSGGYVVNMPLYGGEIKIKGESIPHLEKLVLAFFEKNKIRHGDIIVFYGEEEIKE